MAVIKYQNAPFEIINYWKTMQSQATIDLIVFNFYRVKKDPKAIPVRWVYP